MSRTFPCTLVLTWNGTEVMRAETTTVCGLETARAHFAGNFTGRDLEAFLTGAFGLGVLNRMLQPGESHTGCYGDASGSAAFHLQHKSEAS